MICGITSEAACPFLLITAKRKSPLGVDLTSASSRLIPAPLRKPAIACSGASARGPRRSSLRSGCVVATSLMDTAIRRGPDHVCGEEPPNPASANAVDNCSARRFSAATCIRAGISSPKSSINNSAIGLTFLARSNPSFTTSLCQSADPANIALSFSN